MQDFSHLKQQTLSNGSVVFTDLEQGTEDWHNVRLGILTASEAGLLFVNGKRKDKLGGAAVTAAYRVAGEIYRIAGGYDARPENWSNQYTERGHALEAEWREELEFITGQEIVQVGFLRNDNIRFGGSPDGLLGDDGVWECKSHKPEILIPMIMDEGFPSCHMPQCAGNLFTTGRDYVRLTAGFPGMPRLERFLRREELKDTEAEFHSKLLAFNELVDDTLEQLRKGDVVAMAAE